MKHREITEKQGLMALAKIITIIVFMTIAVYTISKASASTTVQVNITNSYHDVEYYVQTDYFDNPDMDTRFIVQTSTADIITQLNFLDVGIPANANITSVTLNLNVGVEQGSSSSYSRSMTIYGTQSIALNNLTSVGNMESSLTTEHVNYQIGHLTTGWKQIDITDIVKEIYSDNSASWSTTSDIGLQTLATMYSDQRYFNNYAGGVAPYISITYNTVNGTKYRGYTYNFVDTFDVIGIDHQYKPTVLQSTSYTNRTVSYDDSDIANANFTEPWYNGTFPDGMTYDGYYEGYVNYASPLMNGFGSGISCSTIQDIKAIPRKYAPVGTFAIGDVGGTVGFEFAYLMSYTAVSGSYSGWSVKTSNSIPAVGMSLEVVNGTHLDVKAHHNAMMSAWSEASGYGYLQEDESYVIVSGLSNPPPAYGSYNHWYWAVAYHLNANTGVLTNVAGCSAAFNMSSGYDSIVNDLEYINNQNGATQTSNADINCLAGFYPNDLSGGGYNVYDENGTLVGTTGTTDPQDWIDNYIYDNFYSGSNSGFLSQMIDIIGLMGVLIIAGSIFMGIGSLQRGDFSGAIYYICAGVPIGYAFILTWLGG